MSTAPVLAATTPAQERENVYATGGAEAGSAVDRISFSTIV
jgi:hypothetical protein